jgi:hypothetical protein
MQCQQDGAFKVLIEYELWTLRDSQSSYYCAAISPFISIHIHWTENLQPLSPARCDEWVKCCRKNQLWHPRIENLYNKDCIYSETLEVLSVLRLILDVTQAALEFEEALTKPTSIDREHPQIVATPGGATTSSRQERLHNSSKARRPQLFRYRNYLRPLAAYHLYHNSGILCVPYDILPILRPAHRDTKFVSTYQLYLTNR